jgi:hypothetical protein
MNYNAIASVIFLGSFLGLGGIIFKKIPVLKTLPEGTSNQKRKRYSLQWGSGLKKVNPLNDLQTKSFLQKLLQKIRIISLKTDNRTFSLLQKLKEDTQRKKIREDEEYWDKVKDATEK